MSSYPEITSIYKSLGVSVPLLEQWASPAHDIEVLTQKIATLKPKRILEVGTFVGFATIAMAKSSPPETVIHSIDPNLPLISEMGSLGSLVAGLAPDLRTQELAARAAGKAEIINKVKFHSGGFTCGATYASVNGAPSQQVRVIGPEVCEEFGPFDFIFIDGLHYAEAVRADLELASRYLTAGGVIALDDTLDLRWGQHVREGLFSFLKDRHDFIFFQDRNWDPMVDIGFLHHVPDGGVCEVSSSPYDEEFFQRCIEMHSQVVPHLAREIYETLKPKSVIDLGCGAGMWLGAFQKLGVIEICGVDGSSSETQGGAAKTSLESNNITVHDLCVPYNPSRRYDLCLCLDVIEHIDPKFEDVLLDSMIKCSDHIIFSSPPPGQGGDGHINERPIAHWVDKFFERGFILRDILRPRFEGMTHLRETTYQLNLYYVVRLFEPRGEMSSAQVLDLLCEKESRIERLFLQSLFQSREIDLLRKSLMGREVEISEYGKWTKEAFEGIEQVVVTCSRENIIHDGGNCYYFPFKNIAEKLFGRFMMRADFALYENGVPLQTGNAMHDDIRQRGNGLVSIWKDQIYFSSSDNSDPRTNGRTYTFEAPTGIFEASA